VAANPGVDLIILNDKHIKMKNKIVNFFIIYPLLMLLFTVNIIICTCFLVRIIQTVVLVNYLISHNILKANNKVFGKYVIIKMI